MDAEGKSRKRLVVISVIVAVVIAASATGATAYIKHERHLQAVANSATAVSVAHDACVSARSHTQTAVDALNAKLADEQTWSLVSANAARSDDKADVVYALTVTVNEGQTSLAEIVADVVGIADCTDGASMSADTDNAIALNEAAAAGIDSAAGDFTAAAARYTEWASDVDEIVALEQELQLGEAQDAYSASIEALITKGAQAQAVLDESADRVADNATRESLLALITAANETAAAGVPQALEEVNAAIGEVALKTESLQNAMDAVNDSVATKTAADAAAAAAKAAASTPSKSSASGTSGGRSTSVGDGGRIMVQNPDTGLWLDVTDECTKGYVDCTYEAP